MCSYPKDKAILFLTDVFGVELQNARVSAHTVHGNKQTQKDLHALATGEIALDAICLLELTKARKG